MYNDRVSEKRELNECMKREWWCSNWISISRWIQSIPKENVSIHFHCGWVNDLGFHFFFIFFLFAQFVSLTLIQTDSRYLFISLSFHLFQTIFFLSKIDFIQLLASARPHFVWALQIISVYFKMNLETFRCQKIKWNLPYFFMCSIAHLTLC